MVVVHYVRGTGSYYPWVILRCPLEKRFTLSVEYTMSGY